MNTQIRRMKLSRWDSLRKQIDKRYVKEVIGGKPNGKRVREENPDDNPITIMEWAFLLFFAVLAFFAMFKVVPTAVAWSTEFYGDNPGRDFFIIGSVAVFSMMNTVGFILAKLQTEEPSIQEKMMVYPIKWMWGVIPYNVWKIEVWSPRLFHVLVYIILIWQILIAMTGIRDTSSLIQWADAILPVLAEIASATLLAALLLKVRLRTRFVRAALKIQREKFKKQMADRFNDPEWLRITYQLLREELAKHNKMLQTANAEATNALILAEYLRLNAGQDFAIAVFEARNVEASNALTPGEPEESDKSHTPPNGDTKWTAASLRAHFMARTDLTPSTNYTEKHLNAEYEGSREARKAFRNGAKLYFNQYK